MFELGFDLLWRYIILMIVPLMVVLTAGASDNTNPHTLSFWARQAWLLFQIHGEISGKCCVLTENALDIIRNVLLKKKKKTRMSFDSTPPCKGWEG